MTTPKRRTRGRRLAEPIVRLDALDRKRNAEARLKELEVEQVEGRLVSVAEAEAVHFAIADTVREALLSVPGAAVQAGLVAPQHEGALDDLIRAALRNLPERHAARKEKTQ